MKEDQKIHIVGNTDNTNLGPLCGNGFVIGSVDEVNGRGGKQVPEFAPTCDELLQTVKYWTRIFLRNEWFSFNTGGSGSSEWRQNVFADRRISHIANLIGEEDVQQAIDEVHMQFREHNYGNMKLWQIFVKGSNKQRDMVQDEFQRCASGGPEAADRWIFAPNITLTSPSFQEGQFMPDKFTSKGLKVSPPLAWSVPPNGTYSLAITMCDLDSDESLFSDWIIFNIPPDLREISEAMPPQEQLPNGCLHGKNTLGKIGYYAPSQGSPFRRYHFHIYALDQRLDLAAGISMNQLLDAMEGHVIDEGNLTVIS